MIVISRQWAKFAGKPIFLGGGEGGGELRIGEIV